MSDMQIMIDGQPGHFPAEGGVVRMGDDNRMNVLFYKKAVHDPIKSRELGRPFSLPRDYVRIQQPGEKDCVDRPVLPGDPAVQRWPRQWDQYQKQQVQAPAGTPVDVLFPQNPEIGANLHGLGCHTVEQLAGMTEHGAQTIGMGAVMWRNKAKEFLAAANGGAGMHKLMAENDKLKNTIEVQGSQIALMQRQLETLAAQVNQKLPPAMIPVVQPTIAQEAMHFSNDGPEATEFEATSSFDSPVTGGEPLFIDETNEPNVEDAGLPSKPKAGRPKGSRNTK